MYHLPAYVALRRWAAERTAVVVAPDDLEGPRTLLHAGAKQVVVVDPRGVVDVRAAEAAGIDVVAALDELGRAGRSLRQRVELLACIEGYGALRGPDRAALLGDARVWLADRGVFAAWMRHDADGEGLDFWEFEDELRSRFASVHLLAQIPWEGVSLAPVLDEGEPAIGVRLDEALLGDAPEASHYLAIAARRQLPEPLASSVTQHCVLVPMPSRALEVPEPAPAPDPAQLVARRQATDLSVLTRTVGELEQTLARVKERSSALAEESAEHRRRAVELEARHDALAAERESLARQLESTIVDRETARQKATRTEAELEITRRRLVEHEEKLASKTEDLGRVSGELGVLRAKLEHESELLEAAKSREEELSATAVAGVEQWRVLTEVAQDRDRLREELARRAQEIHELEGRLWTSREEVQKERLDNVRLGGEVERLRDNLDRSQVAETANARQIEALSGDLHRLEAERASLDALVKSREDEVRRLAEEAASLVHDSDEVGKLREQLIARGKELDDVKAELQQVRAREAEAQSRVSKRDVQLSQVGTDVEGLRKKLREHETTMAGLRSEVDVRALEVEQMSASVTNLKQQLDEERSKADRAVRREAEMQRELERGAAEQQGLRRRIRELEDDMEHLVSAKESSGVELYKLRQELDATSAANEHLEEALGIRPGAESTDAPIGRADWPEDAVSAMLRLRAQLAAQAQRHAQQLAAREDEGGPGPSERDRIRRLQLEIEVRAREQVFMLAQLDAAEQRIWEMADAADRNAARLAASLAQLEKHKELISENQDELEVTRKLLTAAQARALEQERLLASERAKLARVGAAAAFPGHDEHEDVDDLFAELEVGGRQLVDLSASPPRSAGSGGAPTVRVVVEALDDHDWPEDAGDGTDPAIQKPGAKPPKLDA